MTQDEIIDLAKQAGFDIDLPVYKNGAAMAIKLGHLVAAKEREACAKVVDDWSDWHGGTELIAAVIRERGQA